MAKVSAIVLAAGLSRRMGKDNKMELLFQGKPIVYHVIDQLSASHAFEIIIVTSEVSSALFPDRTVVLNKHYKTGMTSSIQAGVKAASFQSDGYMICLGDQPLVTTTDYNQIIQSFGEHVKNDSASIVLPTYNNQKGNPVVFSSTYKNIILNHNVPEGCKEIVVNHEQHVERVRLNTDGILRDIDTPADYEQIKSK